MDVLRKFQASSKLFKGNVSSKLKFLFITPLFISIILMAVLFIASLYFHEQQKISDRLIETQKHADAYYLNSIKYNIQAILAMTEILGQDSNIQKYFLKKDRNALLKKAKPIMNDINESFNITHLYFIQPDKKVFLRAHAPLRYDDIINRVSLNKAIEDKKASYGIEIGPLGTLTLRVVSPWYNKSHQLMGYIELGMEIDSVVQQLQKFVNLNMMVAINKKVLKRSTWVQGLSALGRSPNWEQFNNVVINNDKNLNLPKEINQCISNSQFQYICTSLNNEHNRYRLISLPITDALGQNVAKVLMVFDLSNEIKLMRVAMIGGSTIILFIGIILFLFFYLFLSQIANRIKKTENRLINLATRDGLTNLYNHKTFYELLKVEISRATRSKQPLVLLMIDFDFFKEVNDTYGHKVGDRVLQELSALYEKFTRDIDLVCRYGGEEIMIIMPGLLKDQAIKAAERLRSLTQNYKFTGHESVHITISIGITFFSEENKTEDSLVTNVDNALYLAKKSGRNSVQWLPGSNK